MRTFLCVFSLLLPCSLLMAGAAHAIEGGSSPQGSAKLVDPNIPTSLYAGVGSINGGTGTLLDPYHVLTAAHVVDNAVGNPSGISFVLNVTGDASEVVTAAAIAVDPLWDNFQTNDNNDFAIVTLSRPVTDAPYYSLYAGPLTAGTTLTLAGYGQTGDGVDGYTQGGDGVTKRVGYNNADGFLQRDGQTVSTTDPSGDGVYVFDFDGPTLTTNQIGGGTLGNGVEANLGVGDSGGPAFVRVGGQLEIAGVNTFLLQFGTKQNPGPDYGYFGSGGGGVSVFGATQADGFLSPYAAPEPGAWAVFLVGGAGIVAVKRRRRPSAC